MRKELLATALCLLTLVAAARADNVSVHGTLGMLEAQLVDKDLEPVGTAQIWNTKNDFNVVVTPLSGQFTLSKVYVYLSNLSAPPPGTEEEPDFGEWPYSVKFKDNPPSSYSLVVPLSELDFLKWGPWGEPWLDERLATVAVRVELKSTDSVPVTVTAWALNPNVPLGIQQTGWGQNALAMLYELQHPKHGHFVGPVNGLGYTTITHTGVTGVEGGFQFYPEEFVEFSIAGKSLGFAVADQRVSPLDVFPGQEVTDPAVLNMARFLLTLDGDGNAKGSINITGASQAVLAQAMQGLGMADIDFGNTGEMNALIAVIAGIGASLSPQLVEVSVEDALAWLEPLIGNSLVRRNVSKTPEYEVDKPKLDIVPVWVPAKTANGDSTTVEYLDEAGYILEKRNMVKPLVVTYTQERPPQTQWGLRGGSDIITAVSMDDGATWKRFNISHMAWKSSFTLNSGEKFPGNCRGPVQKIAEGKILVAWTSAYARGGKPSFAIKTDDDYTVDDPYAVNDIWGVRGKQGSVDYDEDKDVGDQGIGEIPYYALWTCRAIVVTQKDHDAGKFTDTPVGEILWFKPERLTSGRRDAFFVQVGAAKNAGFAVSWQEDPGGLRPGSCKGGGHGWSGATVHKKTDIWYSFLRYADFDKVDIYFQAADHTADEHGEDDHGQQPEISNRLKWLVPMSLPVRVSDNNTVNTENLKVELDPDTGLPLLDEDGEFIPLDGALEEDYLGTDHEHEGSCDDSDDADDSHEDGDGDHGGQSGTGGGWGMARYAYMHSSLDIADKSGSTSIWDHSVDGDYRPNEDIRWYRFINKPGVEKTVVVTADGRALDGDTGACRPNMKVMPGGWVILGYEETKGLGIPPEGDHDDEHDDEMDRPEPDDSGKNVIYHSFKFDQPDLVSAGNIVNLPAIDDDGNLIPIYYKDKDGDDTEYLRQFKTEVARRIRFIAQPKNWMGSERTVMLAVYKQGREGSGKPSDVFAVRVVVPTTDKSSDNPYRFDNFEILDESVPNPDDRGYYRYQRKVMNMSGATVKSMDPVEKASDGEGNSWYKVGKWKQNGSDLSAESFANPYSDAKAHRGFIRGNLVVFGYSFTPNWGRLGGDHMDFFVRRSFTGGRTWTTDPDVEETVHTLIERDPSTGEFKERQVKYGPGAFEPGRNVSLLKGNSHTIVDPRLVPPMGPGTVNPTYPQDDKVNPDVYYVTFGTAKVLHGIGQPMGVEITEKADLFYTRTEDGGTTFYQVPWVINPDSASPAAGETVYRWDWLAKGPPHQGHSQIRMHPSGTRLYAIWHQWADGDEPHLSPHDMGNDIWFRRINFMKGPPRPSIVVDSQVAVRFGRMIYNRLTGEFCLNVQIMNVSAQKIDAPFYLVVTSTGCPTVTVVEPDGVTPHSLGEKPYFDLTTLLGDGTLSPGEIIYKTIRVSNPDCARFALTVSCLGGGPN